MKCSIKIFNNNEIIIVAITLIIITKRKKAIKNKDFGYIPVYESKKSIITIIL